MASYLPLLTENLFPQSLITSFKDKTKRLHFEDCSSLFALQNLASQVQLAIDHNFS